MSFELFPENSEEKKTRTNTIKENFKSSKLYFKILTNDIYNAHNMTEDNSLMINFLCKITTIFQTQLPKMPKEYIHRQVFDGKHRSLALFEENEIVGGICYRPFYQKQFAEIVFCAIESQFQVKGYGGFMMDFFKEHIKEEAYINIQSENEPCTNLDKFRNVIGLDSIIYKNLSLNYLNSSYKPQNNSIHLMTYADNYAIGYFKKNGFTTEMKFKNWVGCIKDYDGGTMMQCKILWEVNYIKKDEFLAKMKEKLIKKLTLHSSFNVIRKGVNPKDYSSPYEIPGIKEAKLEDYMMIKKTKDENIRNALKFFLSDLQANSNSWPFMTPVKANEVPDYYLVIKNPMDLSTIEKKIENGLYLDFSDFDTDFKLMIENCFTYNAPFTQYYKCAQKLKEYYQEKIQLLNLDPEKKINSAS